MKVRTITIPKSEILFDVDAVTHVFTRTTESANLRRADALESDTGDDLNHDIIVRFADRRVAELEERLSHFLATTTATSHSVEISEATSYEFSFYVEDGFEDTQLKPLAEDLESYIAKGVTSDWYMANGDAQGATFAQMLPVILNRILLHIVERKFPTRI